jgi:SAM-dependent methyltransferase
MVDAKQRFSNKVENYVRYRPGYPSGVIDLLRVHCGLTPSSSVADIGSGTGILTRLFLELGCHVWGVEPNREMREAGERLLAGFERFSSLNGSAEESGLADACADMVIAGQAFHWFNPERARLEFQRILRPDGWVALVWNERRTESTPFLRAYEAMLLRHGTDYSLVNHLNVESDPNIIPQFFGGAYREDVMDNLQMFDFEGVRGRLLSSSYIPDVDQPGHALMLAELRDIFDRYQEDGKIAFEYDTRVYSGQLA